MQFEGPFYVYWITLQKNERNTIQDPERGWPCQKGEIKDRVAGFKTD